MRRKLKGQSRGKDRFGINLKGLFLIKKMEQVNFKV